MATAKPIITAAFGYETLEETLDIKQKSARLAIGIPKEIAFQEERIALIPEAVSVLVNNGHQVMIESKAGEGSKFSDKDFSEAGAIISYDAEEIYKQPIIIKSAPITVADVPKLQRNQIIVSPLNHTLLKKEILEELAKKKITALGFELLKDDSGTFPIVRSMSEIAGSASMLLAGQFLASSNGGKGVLLGGISGIPPTKVIIIGAGVVGEFATRSALAMGASVKVFDNNVYRLKRLQNNLGFRVWTSVIEPKILAKQLKTCEVAVGALSSAKGRVPIVATEHMVSHMRQGSVIIDVSIDRGGVFETSEITSHEHPTFIKHGVIHYCVPNIASGFARTASHAISNVLMPLLLKVADNGGLDAMLWHNFNLREGIYMYKGCVTNIHLSERFDIKYTDLNLLLATSRR
ncbi:alanine dehydrogenase [Arachidicoccus ginsenosidimutans]|uniref:alanine dehydrogenase n=1 Tax=Arachidicoccus sp. BS20 TaxID=1850526 RepID=UPI0007F0C237|nr:alanine dehydrogenase [Arachidicoccus sp. BS20]ANI89914.1 alanine dehydrogenase [Arachidicoccus sp. BS20]